MGIILMLASQCHYHYSWLQTFSNELLQVVLFAKKNKKQKQIRMDENPFLSLFIIVNGDGEQFLS